MKDEVPLEIYEEEIQDLLLEIGVPTNLVGFVYLTSAEEFVLHDPTELYKITGLYADIAHKHHTSVARVERAIRHAIHVAWLYGNMAFIDELFKFSINPMKGAPSNSQFISRLYFYLNKHR